MLSFFSDIKEKRYGTSSEFIPVARSKLFSMCSEEHFVTFFSEKIVISTSSDVDCWTCCLLTFFRRGCKNSILHVSEEHFVGFFPDNNVIFTSCEYDGTKSYLLTI